VAGQGTGYIKARYTKYEYEVSMRDGVRLFTAVYIPKAADRPEPILLPRTPFSVRPYGEDQYPETLGPSEFFAREGYIFAYQDVRGQFHSEGDWPGMLADLEHLVRNNPDFGQAWSHLAMLYQRTNRTEDANRAREMYQRVRAKEQVDEEKTLAERYLLSGVAP